MGETLIKSTVRTAANVLDRAGVLRARFQRIGGLRVLGYHGICADAVANAPWLPSYFVTASQFAEHLAMLQRFGPFVFLPDLMKSTEKEGNLRAGIAITFDDVAACTVEHALPILKRLGVRASFFVSTGHAKRAGLFPADILQCIRANPNWVSRGMRESLASLLRDPGRHKQLTVEALQILLAEAEVAIRRHADRHIIDTLRCMDWGEARTVANAGHEIGGHTVDHAILSRQSPAVRRAQIQRCFDDITFEIGTPPIGFAFPNGGPNDFDAEDQRVLCECGFAYALSTTPGPMGDDADRFAIPRTCVGRGHSAEILAVELSGLLDRRRQRQQSSSGIANPIQLRAAHPTAARALATPRATASMRPEEYAVLDQLLMDYQPRRTLEIGMATGESTERICTHLHAQRGEKHVAIDPFQFDPAGWSGMGAERIARAGLSRYLDVQACPDYLALPKLVESGRRFDFILIDGWHSFDYTQLDLFYADLLLNVGGVIAIHDTNWPAVYRACRFLETHKPYERIGPPISVTRQSLFARAGRRLGQVVRGPAAMRAAQLRRTQWFALAAYRKRADHQVPNDFHTSF